MSERSAEVQLAVLTAKLDTVITQMRTVVAEQQDTNTRLAKLESWRSFMLGVWAAAMVVGGVVGWFANVMVGHG